MDNWNNGCKIQDSKKKVSSELLKNISSHLKTVFYKCRGVVLPSCNDSVTLIFSSWISPRKNDMGPGRLGEFLSIFPPNTGLPLHYLCDALSCLCPEAGYPQRQSTATFLRFSGAQTSSGCVSAQHTNPSLLFPLRQLSEICHDQLNI
jgi:hypothetical protein